MSHLSPSLNPNPNPNPERTQKTYKNSPSEQTLKMVVNKQGQKCKSDYGKFIYHDFYYKELKSKDKKNQLIVIIKNIKTKDLRHISKKQLINRGVNPFHPQVYLPDMLLKEKVNKIGISSNHKKEHFIFVKRINKGRNFKVQIMNKRTKATKEVYWGHIKIGKNPFNIKYKYIEKNIIHPTIMKKLNQFKSQGIVYEYEYSIKNNSDYSIGRVDFKVINKNTQEFILLELKNEKSSYGKNKTYSKQQFNKYNDMYLHNKKYKGIFFCSPEGKIYPSIKEGFLFIKQKLLSSQKPK